MVLVLLALNSVSSQTRCTDPANCEAVLVNMNVYKQATTGDTNPVLDPDWLICFVPKNTGSCAQHTYGCRMNAQNVAKTSNKGTTGQYMDLNNKSTLDWVIVTPIAVVNGGSNYKYVHKSVPLIDKRGDASKNINVVETFNGSCFDSSSSNVKLVSNTENYICDYCGTSNHGNKDYLFDKPSNVVGTPDKANRLLAV